MRTVAEFAPWGFQIATYLHVCIGVGFLIVFYERVQHDLSDSEQQYRSMFENAIEGIFRVSPDGDFRAANPALLDMLGYPSAAELTRLDTVEDLWVNPDDRAVLQADRERAQQGVEVEWRRRDGQPIKVLLRGYEVTDSHGNLLHYEGSVRDITAEKVMENQLAVSRKLDALGRLAGGVAHDFNNMLTAILMSVDFAERAAEHNESPVQDLEIIRTAGERASDLTQKLLAFSRKRVTPPELIDLNQAVANACAMLDRLLTDDIDLRVDTTDQALPIETAPGHLEQIVLNLATNAEQAMPDGGELSIRTCLIDADTPMAQLVVRDTGVGMDEETQLKLFDPFYSTRQPEEGTGLGLTTVFGIVHQLDGDIELESHRGEGTEFRIVLPLSADEPQKEEETTELDASEVSLADKTILVVDDEAVVRRVITRALESAGCQLIVATNGAQAIELGRRHIDELDLIISDMVMPGKSGPEVVEALHEIAPDLPYLFVSGYAEETLEERGLEPHEWLSKPVSFSRLLLRVDELLSRHDTSGIR
ncbi:MAG: ATP-binding protein [Persicimonas sp.]